MFPELLTVIQLEPLLRATAKRPSVAVAQLELDVLVISFYGFRTDPEFLRDSAGSETGTAQCKYVQFAVGEVRALWDVLPAGRRPRERRAMRSAD